jgi:hypothetical protein
MKRIPLAAVVGLVAATISQPASSQSTEQRLGKVVCTENLNPNVLTMKSAQYGARIYDAGSLNLARDRRILVQ